MKEKNYHAINWTDGVKITKDHFLESHYHVVDMIQDRTAMGLHGYDYGLLAAHPGMLSPLEVKTLALSAERLTLQLQYCNAITQGGCRIDFSPEAYGGELPTATLLAQDLDTNTTEMFYVVVVVNPFELIPVGEPDPEAIPLHHPYVLPKISLAILPKSKFNTGMLGRHYLMVGKVYWQNGGFVVDHDYLPPVARIMNHRRLHEQYKKIVQTLMDLKPYIVLIRKKNRDKPLSNHLVRNTFAMGEKVMGFVNQHAYTFNHTGEGQPPIYLAQQLSVLANELDYQLQVMEEDEKEKLLQYYYEWTDIKPSDFESVLGDATNIPYSHEHIHDMLEKAVGFVSTLQKLWARLSQLEYIGQRKDNLVVSEDNDTVPSDGKNKSWSIID